MRDLRFSSGETLMLALVFGLLGSLMCAGLSISGMLPFTLGWVGEQCGVMLILFYYVTGGTKGQRGYLPDSGVRGALSLVVASTSLVTAIILLSVPDDRIDGEHTLILSGLLIGTALISFVSFTIRLPSSSLFRGEKTKEYVRWWIQVFLRVFQLIVGVPFVVLLAFGIKIFDSIPQNFLPVWLHAYVPMSPKDMAHIIGPFLSPFILIFFCYLERFGLIKLMLEPESRDLSK